MNQVIELRPLRNGRTKPRVIDPEIRRLMIGRLQRLERAHRRNRRGPATRRTKVHSCLALPADNKTLRSSTTIRSQQLHSTQERCCMVSDFVTLLYVSNCSVLAMRPPIEV